MKTTAAHFEVFRRECLRWHSMLGLTDWQVTFTHKPVKDRLARCVYYFRSRRANVILSTRWDGEPVTAESLSRIALHEVLHLALADLVAFANAAVAESRVDEAEHAAIQRLCAAMTSERRAA